MTIAYERAGTIRLKWVDDAAEVLSGIDWLYLNGGIYVGKIFANDDMWYYALPELGISLGYPDKQSARAAILAAVIERIEGC